MESIGFIIFLMVLVWIIEPLCMFVAYTLVFIIVKLDELVGKVKNTFGSKRH